MPLPKFLSRTAPIAATPHDEPMGGGTGLSSRLTIEMPRQERSNWCWSAVGCAVASFYDVEPAWTQCALANASLQRVDCCQDASAACNVPWYLDRALQATGTLEKFEDRALPFEEIQGLISAGRPVCTRVGWYGGGGHFQVIVGWSVGASGATYIEVADPLFESQTIEYLSFLSSYRGSGRWTHSYRTRVPEARTKIAAGGRTNFDPLSIGA